MKEKILTKLQEWKEDDLAAMEFAAERSMEIIRAYCGIDQVPEELLGVAVSLTGMLLENGTAGIPSVRAKSVKEGDVSVTFAAGISGEDTLEMLKCFKVELDRYRRVDW